jgi:hypothetical protein
MLTLDWHLALYYIPDVSTTLMPPTFCSMNLHQFPNCATMTFQDVDADWVRNRHIVSNQVSPTARCAQDPWRPLKTVNEETFGDPDVDALQWHHQAGLWNGQAAKLWTLH